MLGPQLVFEADIPEPTNQQRSAMVFRASADKPIILSGLPAYQSAAFFMPIDARPTSGHLQIDATVQALTGVESVLRVSIGNVKRAELLLRPGEAGRSLQIQLTEQDIARERLVVSFSLQGEGPHTPCGSDEGVEAIVEIETTSAIHLELESPLDTPRDQVLSRGRTATIGWQTGSYPSSLLAARDLLLAGIAPRFDETGLNAEQGTEAARFFARTAPDLPYAWSAALDDDASTFGMRRFHRSHSWRVRYDMFEALDTRFPGQLDLNMKLGQMMGDTSWHVVVTLNGRHLHDVYSKGGLLRLSLPLDARIQGRVNAIDIRASASHNTPNRCERGPELIAEIEQSTRLLPGDRYFTSPLAALFEMLGEGWNLTSGELSKAEAVIATELWRRFHRRRPNPIVLQRCTCLGVALTSLTGSRKLPAIS